MLRDIRDAPSKGGKRNHIALSIGWKEESNFLGLISSIVKSQIEKDITILSIEIRDIPKERLKELLTYYIKQSYLDQNKIKISFIGKWYDLPGELVSIIKEHLTNTKEYTSFFLNFVVNYDGQQEIVDACKILCRQIIGEKIDVDNITKEQIKDNLYTSYFIPPEIIISDNSEKKISGFFLWDSYYSEIKFVERFNLEEYKRI